MAGWNEALAQILAQFDSDVRGLGPAPDSRKPARLSRTGDAFAIRAAGVPIETKCNAISVIDIKTAAAQAEVQAQEGGHVTVVLRNRSLGILAKPLRLFEIKLHRKVFRFHTKGVCAVSRL